MIIKSFELQIFVYVGHTTIKNIFFSEKSEIWSHDKKHYFSKNKIHNGRWRSYLMKN